MKDFKPIQRLQVSRILSDGEIVTVGEMAQSRRGVFFQYDPGYLAQYPNLSPFHIGFNANVQSASSQVHYGIHGVFADSLPDGWGLLLMDRVFRQNGILPSQVTAMDRLAFVGNKGIGALRYEPCSQLNKGKDSLMTLGDLGLQAQAVFEGQTQEVLSALVVAGSSGGARPKALLYLDPKNTMHCSTYFQHNKKAYLVKFTSSNLSLAHEEGLCEAVYLTLAKKAGIDDVPVWTLLSAPESSGATHWLALERFDTVSGPNESEGRLHFHSACGLLDADFRAPSLDYEDLIKASSILCKSPLAGQAQFRRAMFNLFSMNQDDHSKNWGFLQNDHGEWNIAPFYDVTFSPSPFGEHATAFGGFGKEPPLKVVQQLATQANFSNWDEARHIVVEVVDALNSFSSTSKELGVSSETTQLIQKQLNIIYKNNRKLL